MRQLSEILGELEREVGQSPLPPSRLQELTLDLATHTVNLQNQLTGLRNRMDRPEEASEDPMTEDIEDLVEHLTSRQPTRKGKTRPPRRFDQTQLRARADGRTVGRDYAAHFFRWAWVTRQIEAGQRILDIGCGQDTPLVYLLTKYITTLPKLYVGVDLNQISNPTQISWTRIVDEFNFVDDYLTLSQQVVHEEGEVGLLKFDVATCLEVIEHMEVPDGRKLLQGLRHWVKPDGYLYLSTPVFDGHAAVNHIHEYTVPELKAIIESEGWEVEKRWGTFANYRDIKKVALPDELAVLDRLGLYYNEEVQSVFLAPLYPDACRNNLWVCRRKP